MRRDTWQALRSRVVFVNAPLERSESDSSARIGVSILRKISIGTVQIFQYRYLSKYRYFWQHYNTHRHIYNKFDPPSICLFRGCEITWQAKNHFSLLISFISLTNHFQHPWKLGWLIGILFFWAGLVHTSNLVNIQALVHILSAKILCDALAPCECEVSRLDEMHKTQCFQPQWFCSELGRQHHGELSARVSDTGPFNAQTHLLWLEGVHTSLRWLLC